MHIELCNISKSFGSGQGSVAALDDVTLSFSKGEFAAIVGASGSGKSTLLSIVGCLERPSSGRYILDGDEVADFGLAKLAQTRNRQFGFVFQNFNLLPRLNALENIELALLYAGAGKRIRRNRAMHLLDQVGLTERADHFPHALSGGEQQRVAIARALANEPNAVLADEPTGALDSKSGAAVMNMLSDIRKDGVTIILVTHDVELAARADRQIEMRDGRIVRAGER